jgi:hypothetical protein
MRGQPPDILAGRSVIIMNGNAELLNFVYRTPRWDVNTISQLMDITEDPQFKKQLDSQYNEYLGINSAAKKALNDSGYDEKGIGALEKVKTYLMINLQTLTDKSPAHISEMLMVGSNMGVINAVKT